MLRLDGFDIVAPGLFEQRFSEAEMLGAATWLWMHSASHRKVPLHTLSTLLLPAIKYRQFILASEQGKPVFYLAWADLNEEAERRYLRHSPEQMQDADWQSGKRRWVLDWIAPFGHTKAMTNLCKRRLLINCIVRALYHRGTEKGLRIMSWHGSAVLPEEARLWLAKHPVELDQRARSNVKL